MTVTIDTLGSMSQTELDDLFRRSPRGDLPDGDAVGSVILAPASPVSGPLMWFARWLAWQGKVVYRSRGYLVNKVGPLGLHLFKARVYVAPSWFDNQPAIILDYSKTSLLAHKVRDEIREVSPDTYLGIVFYDRQKTINFVLEFSAAAHQRT